jgi:hypothetical protein
MVTGSLPEEGEARVGPVALPAGRRIFSTDEVGNPVDPVAWATNGLVPDPGLVWSALSDAHPATGLVPVLLAHEEDHADYCFGDDSFDLAEVDQLDGAAVLRARWQDMVRCWTADPEWSQLAPFSREFPGLAPPERNELSAGRRRQVLSSLPPAHIGLIAARRPADAPPVAGWMAFDDDRPYRFHGPGRILPPLWLAAVLRTWEDRFGATLLSLGPGAVLRLFVQRPPTSREATQRIAAEHYVFADGCSGNHFADIQTIATSLVNAPIWQFWWD